jgi:hypothetical protein
VVDTRLSGLDSFVSACQAFSIAWDGHKEDRPILLPIPGRDYVLTGKEAASSGGKTKTVNKTPVSYCIPMSTETLRRNRIATRKETYLAFKEVTLKKGAIMEKAQSLGLSNLDGVHSVFKGIRAHMHIHTHTHITHTQHPHIHTTGKPAVMAIGTSTMNGHYKDVAVSIASGETLGNTEAMLSAIMDRTVNQSGS